MNFLKQRLIKFVDGAIFSLSCLCIISSVPILIFIGVYGVLSVIFIDTK